MKNIAEKCQVKSDERLMTWLNNADKQPDNERAIRVAIHINLTWLKRRLEFEAGRIQPSLPAEGVLSAFGYKVGDFGIRDQNERLRILRLILRSELPPIKTPKYLREWGEPHSLKRENKLKSVLLALIHSAKQRRLATKNYYVNACKAWESDLALLEGTLRKETGISA